MRGLGATSLLGSHGGPRWPLTRLLVHFDNETMPPIDERGASYTVVQAGQSLVADGAYFGERCLHNNRGCGYFTPSKAGFYDSTERDCCLEAFVKLPPSGYETFEFVAISSKDLAFTLGSSNHPYYTYEYYTNPPKGLKYHSSNGLVGNNRYFAGERNAPILKMNNDQWYHVAVYAHKGIVYVSLHGHVKEIGAQDPRSNFDYLCVGCFSRDPDATRYPLLGHIDELRYSVGTSRYTPKSFYPPSEPFVLD